MDSHVCMCWSNKLIHCQVRRKKDERQVLLEKQVKESPWCMPSSALLSSSHLSLCRQMFMNPGELIIKTGLVEKRKASALILR